MRSQTFLDAVDVDTVTGGASALDERVQVAGRNSLLGAKEVTFAEL